MGHYGVQFAKAMGAKVIGISSSESKRDIAKELGCDDYINASNADSMAQYKNSLTHILCTGASPNFQCKYIEEKKDSKKHIRLIRVFSTF